MTCTTYDDPIGYDVPTGYNGVCGVGCVYNDSVPYNAAIPYDGNCAPPPIPPVSKNPKGGGTIINIHTRIDPLKRKRRREDEEILILS